MPKTPKSTGARKKKTNALTVRFSDEDAKLLAKLSKQHDLPAAAVVRMALREYGDSQQVLRLEERLERCEAVLGGGCSQCARHRAESIEAQVAAFHFKFGYPVRATPEAPPDQEVRFRCRLELEEHVEELLEACFDLEGAYNSAESWRDELEYNLNGLRFLIEQAPVRVNLEKLADALGDGDYVSQGFRHVAGISRVPVAWVIQASNMAKEGGARRPDGKLLKPEGWKPPDIAGVLSGARNGEAWDQPLPEDTWSTPLDDFVMLHAASAVVARPENARVLKALAKR